MNLNRGKWDKALQIEIDAQFIFNSIIYESFIQLGYAGEPHRSLSSKYLLARRRENIFTITCGWKHYIPWKILAHCWDLSRGENTLAKGIEEGFMGEQTVDVGCHFLLQGEAQSSRKKRILLFFHEDFPFNSIPLFCGYYLVLGSSSIHNLIFQI